MRMAHSVHPESLPCAAPAGVFPSENQAANQVSSIVHLGARGRGRVAVANAGAHGERRCPRRPPPNRLRHLSWVGV
jgi:hypothetical protein